jgi:PEGA domain
MRRLLAMCLVVLFALGDSAFGQKENAPVVPAAAPVEPQAASGPPPPNTLQDGTAVKLRLTENLTSATAKAGQQVAFEVLEEVDVQGVPVVAKGAQALATVTTAEPKKTMGRGGKLDVNIDSVRLIDGEKAALSATRSAKGGGHTGAMTGAMVGTALILWPVAPLFLFIHGKDITIPKGTEVTAFVAGDMKLDMAKFAPTPSGDAAVAIASAAPAPGLTIEASVPNCDIEVDGNFVGSTPSTLNLAPGKHEIVVKKTGYQDWTRSMMVGSGAVRLSAEMVAK